MDVPELKEWIRTGFTIPDGKILGKSGQLHVTKAAIEPVWYLPGREIQSPPPPPTRPPISSMYCCVASHSDADVLREGVAKRFGVTEYELRTALFRETNGMYPELLTRTDLKVFLPPIGGYAFICLLAFPHHPIN